MAEGARKLSVGSIEVSNSQTVSQNSPKKLDFSLSASELETVKKHLDRLDLRPVAYNVNQPAVDEAFWRKVFQFAQQLGVDTIISNPDPALLDKLEVLANEFGINVAIKNGSRSATPDYWTPGKVIKALAERGPRLGV